MGCLKLHTNYKPELKISYVNKELTLKNSSEKKRSDYLYAFQGQEKDPETGMEAFQLRLWDGRIGRWLTTDPYGEFSSPYLGMGNNPLNLTDPTGGSTCCNDNITTENLPEVLLIAPNHSNRLVAFGLNFQDIQINSQLFLNDALSFLKRFAVINPTDIDRYYAAYLMSL